jgi:hypothetical protein
MLGVLRMFWSRAQPHRYNAQHSALPIRPNTTVPRLRRRTPQDVAFDPGAFDAAVAVRRTAAVADWRQRPCPRGTTHERVDGGRPRGPTRPSRRRRRRRRRSLPAAPRRGCRRPRRAAAALAVATVCCLQVDCAVGVWSGWSQCAAATGRQERTRSIGTRPSSDGRACPALDDATDCAVACVPGAWAPWGECSASCGGGKRARRRAVEVPPKHGGAKCGSTDEAGACNTGGCEKKARTAHNHGFFTALIASRACAGGL